MSDPKIEPKDIIVLDSPEQKITYANIGLVSVSPEDVTLHFGLRTSDPNVANGVAKIYLSLSHAKRLVSAWAAIIQQHEEMFGEIDPIKKLTPKGRDFLDKLEGTNDTNK